MLEDSGMRDINTAKSMARSLRKTLAEKHVAISHSESLEMVARQFGYADWNTLSALSKKRLIGCSIAIPPAKLFVSARIGTSPSSRRPVRRRKRRASARRSAR